MHTHPDTRRPRQGIRLTNHQRTALWQIARGLTTTQIATESGLTRTGAQSRLNRLYTALGARDRAHAVLLAVALGHASVDELLAARGSLPPNH